MTIKELRIKNGFTQKECALFLGMSLRNYQYYENNQDKDNTLRYNYILKKLESNLNDQSLYLNDFVTYNTNVITGPYLISLANSVANYKKRECFKYLDKYVNGNYNGKICILYGLRRTGKTTLLFQLLNELPLDKCAYIKVKTTDNMSLLSKDLQVLYQSGIRYVMIDEITLLDDFINTAALLSDVFSMMGMKIILSGTDSLGFVFANRDELYDRNIMIHTSFISFKEYANLLDINSIDKYIEYGGTLKLENMNYDDPDLFFDEVSFKDDESTRKYIDSSISRNIQHTLKNDKFGEHFNQLKELYEKGELTNVINRIVENMNHHFLLNVLESEFKSHDLGSAKQLLLHEFPDEKAHVLYQINEKEVINRLKQLIEVKEKKELNIKLTETHIEKIKKYLIMLDLLYECNNIYENGEIENHYIITQPGMRYSITKALTYSLLQDQYFNSISEQNKTYIINKILDDVKGRMLEDIILLELNKLNKKDISVFKYKFDDGAEFDMVVYNKATNTCELFEIKHSDKIVDKQTRYLKDEKYLTLVQKHFGNIVCKNVLYRGFDKQVENINYLNVENYLKNLK